MMSMIRDYLLMFFVKIIFALLFLALFLFCVLVGYSFLYGLSGAYTEVIEIVTCPTMKFFVGLAVVGSLFHTAEYKNSPKKFNTNKYLDRIFFEHDSGSRMF